MKSQRHVSDKNILQDPQRFSLVQGGPLYQLLCRMKLSDDVLSFLHRRVLVILSLCWLPLLLLSALEGRLAGGSVTLPFLWDADFHIRFLVSLPLLIAAELTVHRRMMPMTGHFLARGLVPDTAREQFNAAMASALRLRNSMLAEVLMIALVYGFGITVVWPQYVALDATTWYSPLSAEGASLSLAGKWFAYVSLPIFQFLLLRWYFRLFIWARFLLQVSRIDLSIIPTHPDGVGGLGFFGSLPITFSPLLMAQGALLAGLIANRIFYRGAVLPDFMVEAALVVLFHACIMFGPLLVFTPQLERARRKGVGEYGALAARYTREFDAKWLRGGAPETEPLIGSSDIQSLADIGNSFGVVRTMRIVVFTKEAILQLAVLTIFPVFPLVLTMMPLEELLKKLFDLLF